MENIENTSVETAIDQVEGGAVESVVEEKQLTQEDFDKAITKRLAREKSKWEKEYTQRIESERQEAAELAKLSESEKQKRIFEKQVKEFEETKKAFENERLLNETSKQLASKNLPIEFAEMLRGQDAESTFENIKMFEVKFSEALEKAVTDRLKGSTPKASTSTNSFTSEDVKNMSVEEINKNWEQIKNFKF